MTGAAMVAVPQQADGFGDGWGRAGVYGGVTTIPGLPAIRRPRRPICGKMGRSRAAPTELVMRPAAAVEEVSILSP
jgi:hypothetical protein